MALPGDGHTLDIGPVTDRANPGSPPRRRETIGVMHFAFKVASYEDLQEAYHSLIANGIEVERLTDHVSQRSIYQNQGSLLNPVLVAGLLSVSGAAVSVTTNTGLTLNQIIAASGSVAITVGTGSGSSVLQLRAADSVNNITAGYMNVTSGDVILRNNDVTNGSIILGTGSSITMLSVLLQVMTPGSSRRAVS